MASASLSRWKNVIFDAALLSIFGFYLSGALEVKAKAIKRAAFGPDFFPTLISVAVVAICLVLLAFDLSEAFASRKSGAANSSADRPAGEKTRARPVLATFALIVVYIGLLELVGFPLMTFLYLVLQIIVLSPGKPTRRSVAIYGCISAVFSVAVYLIFTELFRLMLPAGILG